MDRVLSTIHTSPRILFKPSPAFETFYSGGLKKGGRYLLRAANRTGKTTHAAALVADALERTPHLRLRGVSVDYSQQNRAMGMMLAQYLSPRALVPGCDFNETRGWSHNLIRLRNGSSMQLLNNTQATQSFEGDALDGVWFDEPPKQVNWLPNISRVMSRRGWILVTATMVGVPVKYLRSIAEGEGSRWQTHVVPFTKEACPWYSTEQIENWLSDAKAAPWEYEQRINAAWEGVAIGRRFTGYTSESIIDRAPQGSWHVGVGIDHGEGTGKQAAVLVLWNDEVIIVLDEYVNEYPTTPEQDSEAISMMLARHGLRPIDVDVWKGDSNTAGKARVGRTVNQLLSEALGLPFNKVIQTPNKKAGTVETGEYLLNLSLMRGWMKVVGPTPVVDEALRYYDGSEKLKHIVDALRYICEEPLSIWRNRRSEISRLYWR